MLVILSYLLVAFFLLLAAKVALSDLGYGRSRYEGPTYRDTTKRPYF